MQDFRKLKVWEKAHDLTLSVYRISKNFPDDEKYGLISQLRRATSSIPINIAEGCGRISKKDFMNFLHISFASASEVDYTLMLSKDLGYISIEDYIPLQEQIEEIKRMLSALIETIKNTVN